MSIMSTENPTTEHRTTERHPYEEEIEILSPQNIKGRAADIGAGGIGIIIPRELPAGTEVELVIMSGHAITIGTVRWTRPDDEGFRTGIQFRTEDWNIIEIILNLRNQEG